MLAVAREYFTYRHSRLSLELVIEIEKRTAEQAGKAPTNGGFASAWKTHQDDVGSLRRDWV